MLLWSKYRLTLFGRSLLLLASELLANIVCWIVAGLLFGKHTHRESVLSLALLSWVCFITICRLELPLIPSVKTIGLRHGIQPPVNILVSVTLTTMPVRLSLRCRSHQVDIHLIMRTLNR